MPVPPIYRIPQPSPNAFATGRSPSHAAVAVTDGILRLLDRRELRGVLAHELAHVKNRDVLTSSIAATIAGAISMIAQMAQFAMLFGGYGGRDDRDRGNPLGALLAMIVAPIAAMLIQLAISRSREYGADHTGAEVSEDPLALASALEKLERGAHVVPMDALPATAHLMIVNPFTAKGLAKLFSTHPPIQDRVERLRAMAGR
jgi:heat shock protein HtpX